MAAEVLAQGGARVTVYDAMPSAGRKFLMAGRGGLNLTHSEPLPQFMARYREAAPKLQAAVEAFSPDARSKSCFTASTTSFLKLQAMVDLESSLRICIRWAAGNFLCAS